MSHPNSRTRSILVLSFYAWQTLILPLAYADATPGSSAAIQAAVDQVDQEQSYDSAIKLGQEAKIANIASASVWGLSAATCGYNCFNYLVTLRGSRSTLVKKAEAVGAIVKSSNVPSAPGCAAGIKDYVQPLNDELAKIEGESTKAEGNSKVGSEAQQDTPDTSTAPETAPDTSTVPPTTPQKTQLETHDTWKFARLVPWLLQGLSHLPNLERDVEAAPKAPVTNGGMTVTVEQGGKKTVLKSDSGGTDPTTPGGKADGKDTTKKGGDKDKADPSNPMKHDESLAGYAQQMATQAKAAATSMKILGNANATDATTKGCVPAATNLSKAADELATAASDYSQKIASVIKLGTYCNYTSVGAGAVDAGLSFGLTKDTTAGIIGAVGAAPGVYGLASSFLTKNTPTDFNAASSGIVSCLATATSLVEVAVKTVEIKDTDKTLDQNKKSLEDLQGDGGSAWLEWFLRTSPFGIPSAHAAAEPSLANACGGSLSAPMAKYSCALAGDTKLRERMAGVPGGASGLFGAGQALFGLSPAEFISTTELVSPARIIGLMTKTYPQLAPRINTVYAAAERRARELSKMPSQVRQDILARESSGMLEHAASTYGQASSGDGATLSISPAAIGSQDAFAPPKSTVPSDEEELAAAGAAGRGPASAKVADAPLPPPPGLGVEEISPASGHTIFELVSRTLRDHRELSGGP